jgi:hypothetical protein
LALVKQFTRARADNRVAQRATLALSETANRLDRIHILAVVLALGMTTYLAVEPSQNWLLLLLCGLAAIGTDGIVRHHPGANFQRLDDTALFSLCRCHLPPRHLLEKWRPSVSGQGFSVIPLGHPLQGAESVRQSPPTTPRVFS